MGRMGLTKKDDKLKMGNSEIGFGLQSNWWWNLFCELQNEDCIMDEEELLI